LPARLLLGLDHPHDDGAAARVEGGVRLDADDGASAIRCRLRSSFRVRTHNQ
jgi:hypothetical protein